MKLIKNYVICLREGISHYKRILALFCVLLIATGVAILANPVDEDGYIAYEIMAHTGDITNEYIYELWDGYGHYLEADGDSHYEEYDYPFNQDDLPYNYGYEGYGYWGGESGYYQYEDEAAELGDIPIMAFGAGREVTFNPNGGITPSGHGYRLTTDDGTLAALPNPPSFGGRTFMWWSLDPLGRDPLVTHFNDRFSTNTYIPAGGLTVFAVWGFVVEFNGNGMILPIPNPQLPTNPNAYVDRIIPNMWSFDEAQLFGLPVTFPNAPHRHGFQFWGWYNSRIPNENIDVPAPPPASAVDRYTIINNPIEFSPRWRLHTHLVMFDMNNTQAGVGATPFLAAGTAAQPQRLYRWVLDGRSIADSGLGGAGATGLGLPSGGIFDPGSPPIPQEWYRQNRQRPWAPNLPPLDPGHIPRWIQPPGFAEPIGNPNFNTPYYPGSDLVRGTAAGVINPQAGTQWPRAAPHVQMPTGWVTFPGSGGSNNTSRARYTLEGWWTTPDGWTQSGPNNIVGRRFAPTGNGLLHTSDHTSSDTINWGLGTNNVNPQGFPVGLARPAQPDGQDPVTGIVTEDMTVYAMWVYRLTFNLNGGDTHGVQNFSIQGVTNFSPGQSNIANYRDILPHLLPEQRTVNQSGQRVRLNNTTGVGFNQPPAFGQPAANTIMLTHQPFWAGMPPDSSPQRAGHIFNGWWDRPVPTVHHLEPGFDTLMNNWPEVVHGAVRITGDTQINGNTTAYAHWRYVPTPPVYVNFHLNVPPSQIATMTTENVHGNAYWPTHRPLTVPVYTNPHGRFFLSRIAITGHNIDIPGPSVGETSTRYGSNIGNWGNLLNANVNYAHRYNATIQRRYGYGNPIISTAHPHELLRMPRNPRRTGYMFVGWSTNPDLSAFQANGLPTGVAGTGTLNHNMIFNTGTPINTLVANTPPNDPSAALNLYAVWAPAFDLIFAGNGHTAPAAITEFTRLMPIGFTEIELQTDSRGWWNQSHGMTWFAHKYHSPWLRSAFSRTGFTAIGTSYAFNTYQGARFGYGSMLTSNTRYNDAFFSLYDANNLQPNPAGNDYLRVYIQWGGTLTFNSNHSTIHSAFPNLTRTASIADGHSVNMTLSLGNRHMHLPTRGDTWNTSWSGTAGTVTVDGTRGGWPHDPASEIPPRTTNVSGGDWIQLFTIPRAEGFALQGWHRNSNGICTPNMSWVTADCEIEGNITVFAIWRQGIVFDPGLGGTEVDMSTVGAVPADWYRMIIPGQPLPNFPLPPTWTGRNFVGWFAVPVPNPNNMPPSLGGDVPVFSAGRFYAVFEAPVRFHPTGPPSTSLGAGGSFPNVLNPNNPIQRDTIIGNPAEILPHERLYRPGWGYFPHNGSWFAVDSESPNGRRIYMPSRGACVDYPAVVGDRPIIIETDLFPQWMSTFTFMPGHTRGRLDTPPVNTNISRQVPEGLNLNAMSVTQRAPAAESATGSSWPNDPGLYFAGWRRLSRTIVGGNPVYTPVNPGGTTPAPGTTPPILTTAQVNEFVATGPNYFFEAVWGLRLEFYKVGETVNETHRLGFNPLPGARFVLERETTAGNWVLAYPLEYVSGTGWQPANPAFVESNADGRVFIDSTAGAGEPFNHLLELLPNAPTVFRLREIQAAPGYRTPPGHWSVSVSNQIAVLPAFTPHNENPAFMSDANGEVGTPYEGYRWQRVGNTPYEFDFWKVNQAGTRLTGAVFRLFVFNGDGVPASVMLTSDMIGSGANQWTEVSPPQTSSTTEAMVFRMRPGRHYQMLEAVPPQGHQMPLGQWRITVISAVMPSYPFLDVNPIGNVPMPEIRPYGTTPETYRIFNMVDFQLPLAGGFGTVGYAIAGMGVLFVAMLSGAVIVLRKHKQKNALISVSKN